MKFIHSFNSVPGTVLGAKNAAMNKNLCIYMTPVLVLEVDNEDT